MKKHILIVEDESDIADALAARLISEGFLVSVADNGIDGLDMALTEHYDVAVLDIMLPGINGLEIAARLRESKDVAILVLSARGDENDIVSGLDIGADDYVTKPFSTREVVARIHALIRRKISTQSIGSATHDVFTFGDLVINGITRSVSLHERFIHTTPTEFRLLNVMCTNPGSVFTREELVDLLTQNEGSTLESNDLVSHSNLRTVDSHVRSLRKKIGAEYIRTVHAVGYSFEPNLGKSQESA